MEKPSNAILKDSKLYQVGIVVRDLQQSIEQFRNVLGIDTWRVIDINPSTARDLTYYGRPVKHGFKIALAMVGSIEVELIQPIEGDNIYSDFLKKHGEGLHHLGHVKVQNLDEAIQVLEKVGFSCMQTGRVTDGAYAYMDTVKSLGVILELFEFARGAP